MVGPSRLRAPLAGQSNAVCLDLVEGQPCRVETAGHIEVVIMSPSSRDPEDGACLNALIIETW
jgi:hypothetical protein